MAHSPEPGDRIVIVDLDGDPIPNDALDKYDRLFADRPVTITIDDGHIAHGPTTYWSKRDVGGVRTYKLLPMERS